MGVVNYYSVGGRLQGEQPVGGSRVDYLTDALGSVTATSDESGSVRNGYAYAPYGRTLAKVGTAPDPSFLWAGEHGYRQTGRSHSDVYVRARHYASGIGRWTTRDPIGYEAGSNVYAYADANPTGYVDPSGLQLRLPFPPPPPPPPIVQPVPTFPGYQPPGYIIGPGVPKIPVPPVPPAVTPAPIINPVPTPEPIPMRGPLPWVAGLFGEIIMACGVVAAFPTRISDQDTLPPSKPCPQCPPKAPRKDCRPSLPHYHKPQGCCDWPHCHTHFFASHQGPWPECICSYKESTVTCGGPWKPGPCPKHVRGGK